MSASPAARPALLRVDGLSVGYRISDSGRHEWLQAVSDVSFDLAQGETLGIVGESGSGKSSIARALLGLTPASAGQALFEGLDLLQLRGAALRRVRRSLQLIFQDPLASLDPRMSAGESVAEPLRVFEPELSSANRSARTVTMLEAVGLSARHLHRLPHELSGGRLSESPSRAH